MVMHNIISRSAFILLLLGLCVFGTADAKKKIPNTKSYKVDSTQFNALNHVLQKPNGNERFSEKRFGDHLFMSVEAGPSFLMDPEDLFHIPRTDARMGISVGDWVLPAHGWRLGLNGGFHNYSEGRPFFGGLSADYLVNFSTLVRGHNARRKFELIGSAGLEAQLMSKSGSVKGLFGFRFGLVARYNISDAVFMYLEPRVGAYVGNALDNTNFKYRLEPSVMFGIGFRRLSDEERSRRSVPFVSYGFEDNMFYGLGGGLLNLRKASTIDGLFSTNNAYGTFFVGKRFSPSSGLRLTASYGNISDTRSMVMGGIDYVWNLTSFFTGFRPDNRFELNVTLGAVGAYASHASAKVYPGAQAGLQGVIKFTPNWGIFIEPQVRVFARDFNKEVMKGNIMGSVNAGVRYSVGAYEYDYYENKRKFDDLSQSKKWFATAGGGVASFRTWEYDYGYSAHLGIGRWVSPMSAFRFTIDGQIFPDSWRDFRSIALSADYMLSISSAMAGFNPDRLFDVSGVLGVYGGMANSPTPQDESVNSTRFFGGLKAALNGRFRVNDSWDIYLEPQIMALAMPIEYGMIKLRPEYRAVIGVNYKF